MRADWWGRRAAMVIGLIQTLGVFGAVRLLYRHYRGAPGSLIEVTPRHLSRSLFLRAGSSDFHTFCHLHALGEYDFEHFQDVVQSAGVRADYDRRVARGEAPLIIDAGANIGLAALWFAHRFPQAKIVSIEPEAGNFALLCRNVTGYTNITPLQAALWGSNGVVSLQNPDAEAWAFRVGSSHAGAEQDAIEAVSVPELMHRFGASDILITKIDIEGAEAELFDGDAAWAARTKLLVVELHDHIFPYRRGSAPFYRVLASLDAEVVNMGENTFVFQDLPRQPAAPSPAA